MKCHGCSSVMVLDRSETGQSQNGMRARTEWHSCPLCGKVRLTSEPDHLRSYQSGLDIQSEARTTNASNKRTPLEFA